MKSGALAQAKTPELLRCWDSSWGQVEGRSSDGRTLLRQQKATCWPFVMKPSDGLEPSTASLPCDPNGNRWQPVATVWR